MRGLAPAPLALALALVLLLEPAWAIDQSLEPGKLVAFFFLRRRSLLLAPFPFFAFIKSTPSLPPFSLKAAAR